MRVDLKTGTLAGPAGEVALTRKERELLACLAGRAGEAISRRKLLEAAWGWVDAGSAKTKTVEMHVSRIRSKIAEAGCDPKALRTVRGEGYMLDGSVSQLDIVR